MASIQHTAWKPRLRRPPSVAWRVIDWSRFLDRPLFIPPRLDYDDFLGRKTVLITGAGGSIGSVLAEYLMGSVAGILLLLDHSQPNLRELYRKYEQRHVTLPKVEFFHVDILHEAALQEIFATYQPHIVFHAAAMKHLPVLESDPFAGLETNLLGTLRLLEMAKCSDVECFVNVSSDKAVNPTSVLGVSKRISELLLLAMESASTRRISLRLGNVLGSSGSFAPLFLQSLEDGLPPQITDPHASRYFVSPEEAAVFLMNSIKVPAAPLLLPEMGKPRRITDLAEFLFLNPGAAEAPGVRAAFEITGLRDGEKLCEQLTYDYESLEDTHITHIHKIRGSGVSDADEFADNLGRLMDLVVDRRKAGLIKAMCHMVPEFTPSPTFLNYVH